jgi:tRNA (guanine10-N2)-dimethyltransferase
VARLFFLVSGEHPTLPFSELSAILEAEGFENKILEKLPQVSRLEAELKAVDAVKYRAALTRVCCQEAFNCSPTLSDIVRNIGSAALDDFIESGETFVVRVRKVKEFAPDLVSVDLERKLGELILEKVRGTKVNLHNPQKTFFGVITQDRFVFGLKMAEIVPKPFVERRPRKRPFFHPSAVQAKLARCMVNLAQPKKNDLVVDPFCGTASMLIEAGLIGCRVLGLDVRRQMINGSFQNLNHYNIEPDGMVLADARQLPIAKTDSIVTDPPYGRSATTLGWSTQQIVEKFLPNAESVISKGKRICMASPKSIRIGKIGEESGFRHLESHFVYVHRSLTREIAVLEKIQ